MTGNNFYTWRWIIDPTRPSSGRTKNWPVQNFVPIGQKENQTPVSSAVTSVRTLAFRNEPSMQREILQRYAKLSTTLFSASISTCRCSIAIKVRSWRTRRPSNRHEVAQNLIRFNGAQARVTAYRSGVRDQAAHNLDVVRQTYSYGRTTLLDVIAEQRRYIDIETGYTDILLDAYAARIALEQAVGTNLP